MRKFWIVWCPLRGEPTVRHETHELAIAEATRLARKHPHNEFTVLVSEETLAAGTPNPPVYTFIHK